MCEHAFYEAINHANNRILYGNPVTIFPHVRASFVDAYARIFLAMKLFSDRAIDYFPQRRPEDRRYLLFNPVTKSKVTPKAKRWSRCCGTSWRQGFEKNTYFSQVVR